MSNARSSGPNAGNPTLQVNWEHDTSYRLRSISECFRRCRFHVLFVICSVQYGMGRKFVRWWYRLSGYDELCRACPWPTPTIPQLILDFVWLLPSRLSYLLGDLFNLAGIPPFMRCGAYKIVAGGEAKVTTSRYYTKIRVRRADGEVVELFFHRLTGAWDGSGVTSDCIPDQDYRSILAHARRDHSCRR